MTAKNTSIHRCADCGYDSPKWFGRCPDCGSWNSAGVGESGVDAIAISNLTPAVSLGPRRTTGSAEMDRVLGGGLVPGQVLLLAGEPGIGKSTLVLQLLQGVRTEDSDVLLLSGEESIEQVSLRARRLGVDPTLRAASVTALEPVLDAITSERPSLIVVDSIQTLADRRLDHGPGSPTQVRHCATALAERAKALGTIVVLVGHVTKDGNVAGPKTLEHLVDTVLALEGERDGTLRLLRPVKNRFGSCNEVGVFEMADGGLREVPDPSGLLLADRAVGVPGSVVFPGAEGSRPLLLEIQALAAETKAPQVRRVAIGLDARRLALILGVLAQRCGIPLHDHDVFAAAAGGVKVTEPASDLPLALALFSARSGIAVPDGLVAFGEVGLAGEVRRVTASQRRLTEAARLGFTTALVPRGSDVSVRGLEVLEVTDVTAAFRAVSAAREPGGKVPVVSLSNT